MSAQRDPLTKKFVKRASPAAPPATIVKTDEPVRQAAPPEPARTPAPAAAPAASPKPAVTAAPADPPRKKWYETIIGLVGILCLSGAGCMSTVTIEDAQRGVTFRGSVPVWPWQDSMRVIDRMNLSAKGTNFTASLRGLSESETTSTNTVDLFERGIGAAVRAAVSLK